MKRIPRILSTLGYSLKPSPWILLSGALIVFAFPPWDLSFLIWIALIPWIHLLEKSKTYKESFAHSLWLSILMTLGGYYWVAYAAHNYGNLPWILGVLVLLLFSLGNQVQFIAFGLAHRWLKRKTRVPLWSLHLALVYAGIDWLLPKLFLDTLGHSLYNAPYMSQAADLGGASILTFCIFATNHAIYEIGIAVHEKRRFETRYMTGLLAFIFCLSYGAIRYRQVTKAIQTPERTVQLAAIQANIGDFDKVAAETGGFWAGEKIIQTYMKLSDLALSKEPRPDALIWPETAYPSNFRTPGNTIELSRDQKVEQYVRTRRTPLLFGGYDRVAPKEYNSLFILTPDRHQDIPGAGDLQVYHKNVLLPFGEYIPGFDRSKFFKKLFPQMGFFGRGPGPLSYEVPLKGKPSFRVAPVICYEALVSSYTLPTSNNGNEIIVNVTNDSWFGRYGEPYLHLALTVFRSIETRLPQIRSTNTGISALILPNGDMPEKTGVMEEAILNVTVPIIKPIKSGVLLLGNWFGPLSLALAIALGLLARGARRARIAKR